MKYIAIINSCYPSLSKTEKRIADYFLDEKGKIIYQTLQEISKAINVGEASIVRFVKKIGFSGFQDMKIEIAKEDKTDEEILSENYVDKIQSNMIKIIGETKAVLDVSELDIAIEIILNSNKVFFFGIGASGITAYEAQNKFMRLGKIGSAITDSHFQRMYSSICTEQDVIIVFSLSGNTKDIVEAMKIAKKEKTKIIAITSYKLSPIAQLADCVVLTAGKENPIEGGSLGGKISQLYILDLLCTGYGLKDKTRSLEIKSKTAKAVANMIST